MSPEPPPPLDPWRLRFGFLLVAVLLLGPFALLLAKAWGKEAHCDEYWTPERQVLQLWAAYMAEYEQDAASSPSPVSRADINQMFAMMRACAATKPIEACTGQWGSRERKVPDRPIVNMTTKSGMSFSWTFDLRYSYAERIGIDVISATGARHSRDFYLPGCDFPTTRWRMPH